MRISDWSSDVCSSDLAVVEGGDALRVEREHRFHVGFHGQLGGARGADGVGLAAFEPLLHGPTLRQVAVDRVVRSEEHTSELQSLLRISYAVFCLKKKKTQKTLATEPYNTHKEVEMTTAKDLN